MTRRRIATIAGSTALVALLSASLSAAHAQRGVAAATTHAPPEAARLGPLCRADAANTRVWWSDRPGAPGALADGDGNCATLPKAVTETLASAEVARRRAVALGFPAPRGDAPPPVARNPSLTRQLLRSSARVRAAVLADLGAQLRGRYLAGLTTAQRARITRGLPAATRGRMAREVRAAQLGRPSDFVGGDRRLDVILDGRGATGMVAPGQPGRAVCRTQGAGTDRTFHSSWIVVLATADSSVRPVVAHEIFHSVQCQMGLASAAPDLLIEGSADWFAARIEPSTYAGAVTESGTEISVTGGNSRVATFCTHFDPHSTAGVGPYTSWAVWQALDAGPRSTVVAPLLRRFAAHGVGPGQVIAQVGARWGDALQQASQAVCGAGVSPDGQVSFAPQVREFIGLTTPAVQVGDVGAIDVPAGGVASGRADWRLTEPEAVTLHLTADGLDAATLAGRLTVTTSSGRHAPTVRDGVAVVDVPAADGRATVTVTNPSTATPLSVRMAVASGG